MYASHEIVVRADFDEPDEARDAMFDLEGEGIDAVDINLVEQPVAVPTLDAQRAADRQITVEVAERYGAGAVVGGVVGALIAMAVAAVLGIDPLGAALTLAGIMGGSAGFFFGGFFNVARHLPVNEDAYETAFVDPLNDEPLHVEVRVEDEHAALRAEEIMHAHGAVAVDRR